MDLARQAGALVRFGPFTLDAARRRLQRGGSPVPLTPKAIDLLAVLVSRAGELVSKEDLLKEVWPDTAVEDNNLARHVSMLRKALHLTADSRDFIVTVQGRGYRFVGAIEAGEATASIAPAAVDAPLETDRPARRRIGLRELAVAVISMALLAAGGVWFARSQQPGLVQRVLGQLTYEPGLQLQPAWAPDRRRVAYASDQAGSVDIWVRAIGSPEETRLTSSPATDWQPAWSPDGQSIAYRSERDGGGLYVISADGRNERRLTTFGYRPQWSPSGATILFSTSAFDVPRGSLYLRSLDGGEPKAFSPPAWTDLRNAHAAWLPGSDSVSISGMDRSGHPAFTTIAIVSGQRTDSRIAPDVERSIEEAGVTLGRFVWSSSRRHLFFQGQSAQVSGVWRVTVDPRTLAWIAGPERLTTGTADDTEMAVSADGTRLAFSSQQDLTRLWALPLDLAAGRLTGEGRPLTSGGAGEFDAAAPADGRQVAYRRIREGRDEVWVQPTDGRPARLLMASSDSHVSSPRWSMDGHRLAFFRRDRRPNGPSGAATVLVSTDTGAQQILATPPGSSLVPDDWSADDASILGACRHTAGQPLGICIVSVSDVSPAPSWRTLAADRTKDLLSPRFSPDQRWISFMAVDRSDSRVSTIYVMPAAGGPWTPVTDGRAYDDKPRWAPDGSGIYFVSSTGGIANVMARRIDPQSGRPSGAAFALTTFGSPQRMLPALGRMEISVALRELFVPISEARGHVWLLDHVDR